MITRNKHKFFVTDKTTNVIYYAKKLFLSAQGYRTTRRSPVTTTISLLSYMFLYIPIIKLQSINVNQYYVLYIYAMEIN